MASSGKKKTTMAKLQRESRLRDKRAEKQARKDERRRILAAGGDPWADAYDTPNAATQNSAEPDAADSDAPAI